jgi:spore coat polysaccharide biosynthesis protein SpsF
MKFVATIEARMTSSRLPGKPLLKAAGKTMLEHLVARLKLVSSLDAIVLATTINEADDDLVSEAKRLGIQFFRGSEDDVMNRVISAAASVDADAVVEITGDCPIIDPSIVAQTIAMFKAHSADYVSNAMVRSYPDGMDVQVMGLHTLRKSSAMTSDPLDLEHVTLHIRNNPDIFSRVHLVAPPELHWPELGLTLDEQKDFELISCLIDFFQELNPNFSCLDAVNHLKGSPNLVAINDMVFRKGNA